MHGVTAWACPAVRGDCVGSAEHAGPAVREAQTVRAACHGPCHVGSHVVLQGDKLPQLRPAYNIVCWPGSECSAGRIVTSVVTVVNPMASGCNHDAKHTCPGKLKRQLLLYTRKTQKLLSYQLALTRLDCQCSTATAAHAIDNITAVASPSTRLVDSTASCQRLRQTLSCLLFAATRQKP